MKRLAAIPLFCGAFIFWRLLYYSCVQFSVDWNRRCAEGWNMCRREQYLDITIAVMQIPVVAVICCGLFIIAIAIAFGLLEKALKGEGT